jgi:glyoxylase-like metal-dependent hydrolase (beta-lactamase superfamily II)
MGPIGADEAARVAAARADLHRRHGLHAVPDEPGCTAVELCPGLWQVAGEGISHDWDAAAYLVGGERPVLIDCGSPLGASVVAANVSALLTDDLASVLLTHGHWDHSGGAAALGGVHGAPVLLHDGDAAAVRAGDPVRTTAALLYDQPFPPFAPDGGVADGDRFETGIATVEAHHTPGHTPGSVCYVVALAGHRVLIAGDTLWGGFHPAIGSDADAWRRSLARLATLDYGLLTFGHGPTRLLGDARERVAEAGERFGHFFDPWHRPSFKQFRW